MVTFVVSKPLKFKLVKLLQPQNIYCIVVTLLVSKLLKSILVKLFKYANRYWELLLANTPPVAPIVISYLLLLFVSVAHANIVPFFILPTSHVLLSFTLWPLIELTKFILSICPLCIVVDKK